jgi:DNA repair exonuclease SbcCD ATPase subunit
VFCCPFKAKLGTISRLQAELASLQSDLEIIKTAQSNSLQERDSLRLAVSDLEHSLHSKDDLLLSLNKSFSEKEKDLSSALSQSQALTKRKVNELSLSLENIRAECVQKGVEINSIKAKNDLLEKERNNLMVCLF